jgi:hypothetical protein
MGGKVDEIGFKIFGNISFLINIILGNSQKSLLNNQDKRIFSNLSLWVVLNSKLIYITN